MLGDILTCSDDVCCVYANWHALDKDWTEIGDAPFGGIETDDVDACEIAVAVEEQRFCELEALLEVLFVVHSYLNIFIYTHFPLFLVETAGNFPNFLSVIFH